MLDLDKVSSGIFGVCIGDALGLPFEGLPWKHFRKHPVTGLKLYRGVRGFQREIQPGIPLCIPPNRWSDNSSQSLCLAQSIVDNEGAL